MAQPVHCCSKRLNAAEAVASLNSKAVMSSAAYSGCICSMCFIYFADWMRPIVGLDVSDYFSALDG
jgi:hypothetical protein